MPLNPLQGIILDVDGTLLDTQITQYDWFTYATKRFNGTKPMPPNDETFWEPYNEALHNGAMVGLYEWLGIEFQTQQKEIWDEYVEFNRTHIAKPIPGIPEAIAEIHQRSRVSRTRTRSLRMAINTTKTWDAVELPLRDAGIVELLDTVVTKNEVYDFCTDGVARRKNVPLDDYESLRKIVPESVVKELEKPHSLTCMLAAQRLGVDPEAIIAFEDTRIGVNAYHRVLFPDRRRDIYVVAVTWGYESRKLLAQAQPDEFIDTPQQLVQLIGDLGGFR